MIEVFNATCYSTRDLTRLVRQCEESWKSSEGCKGCINQGDRLNPPKRILFRHSIIREEGTDYYHYVKSNDQEQYEKGAAQLELGVIGILRPKNWPGSPLIRLARAANDNHEAPRELIQELVELVCDMAGLFNIKDENEPCTHHEDFVWEKKFDLGVNSRAKVGAAKLLKEARFIKNRDNLLGAVEDGKSAVEYLKTRVWETQGILDVRIKRLKEADKELAESLTKLTDYTKKLPELKIMKKAKTK